MVVASEGGRITSSTRVRLKTDTAAAAKQPAAAAASSDVTAAAKSSSTTSGVGSARKKFEPRKGA